MTSRRTAVSRTAARGIAACRVERLEGRQLMSAVAPGDLEQYMLELLNRARANPTAEAARHGIDLNEGLAAGTISTDAKQPLAMNPHLVDAARKHGQWMLDNDVFSHTGENGSTPGNRMANAGYAAAGTFGWGENIAYRAERPSTPPPVSTTAGEHADLFIDKGIDRRGHRTNMMSPAFREIGIGIRTGDFDGFNALMSAQEFGYFGSTSFLTGVAFDDAAVKADDFYTPGEGLGGVTITAVRASDGHTRSATTWSTGGYSLPLPAGTYSVTASGGELAAPMQFNGVAIGSTNVKQDVRASGNGSTGGNGTGGNGTGGDNTDPGPTPSPPTPTGPGTDSGIGGDTTLPPAPPPPPVGLIKGIVWNDANGNGKRDKREGGTAGRTVFLDTNADGTTDAGEPTTTTDAAGAFAFAGLDVGAYQVRVVTPAGWRLTSAGGEAREVGVAGRKSPKLKPFGLTDTVAVGGTVFADADANGAQDAGEPAFRKAKVYLDLNNDGARQKTEPTAKLDKAGRWRIAGLSAGTYTVRLILKPAFAVTAPAGGVLAVDVSTPATESMNIALGVGAAAVA